DWRYVKGVRDELQHELLGVRNQLKIANERNATLTARVAELEGDLKDVSDSSAYWLDIAAQRESELADLRSRLRIKEGEMIEGDYARLIELEDELAQLREGQ